MTAHSGAVRAAEHDVHVRDDLLVGGGEVTEEREHLDLVGHGDGEVVAAVAVEVAQGGALESADGGDLRGAYCVAAGCVRDRSDGVIALVADDDDHATAVDVED